MTANVLVTVFGLPRRQERAFRRFIASLGRNFNLPYYALGRRFDVKLEVGADEREATARAVKDRAGALGAFAARASIVGPAGPVQCE